MIRDTPLIGFAKDIDSHERAGQQISDVATTDIDLAEFSREELVELLEAQAEGGIRINFAGKANARRLARRVRPRITRTIAKYSVGSPEEQASNLVIEGDNLQAMATLYRERGLVDLILTDPPYNTGNDFRYNDRWEDDPNDPGLGEFISPDDRGRHTKWMRFMWPRLQMMRSMLKPGGVLAICVDHRELFRLGQMLDELFREENRIAIINWQKSYAPRGDNDHVSTATEYILVYAKDEAKANTGLLERTAAMDARYKTRDGDPLRWKSGDVSGPKAKTHQSMVYAIQSPFTGAPHYPPDGKCWRPEQAEALRILNEWGCKFVLKDLDDAERRAQICGVSASEVRKGIKGIVLGESLASASKKAKKRLAEGHWPKIYFGVKGEGRPQQKNYLEQVKQGKVPMTFWADEDYEAPIELGAVSWQHPESGHSQTGINELDAILGKGHGFETVKPLRLFQKIIQLWCPPNGVVLDPFAGSGTAGQAVLELNDTSDATRRFILVEQGRPERGDPYAKSLLAKRLRAVITGKWANGKGRALGGGYRFVQLEKKVDADALLHMERSEMVDTVIASHYDDRRRGASLIRIDDTSYRYLVAKNTDSDGIFLVWDGPDKNTNFTEDVYEICAAEAERAELKPTYHVYARFNLYQTDNVRFYQIPDRILADFGLDLSSEPFAESDL